MNKIERVTAVLEGSRPDRPAVSFWYHFPPECAAGPKAVEAHVQHMETYDVDFLKIMDDNRYPRAGLPGGVITAAGDLDKLAVLRGDEDTFELQLELIGELARRFGGELLMATTVFNAWTTLRNMTAPDPGMHGPPTLGRTADPRDAAMARLLHEAPQALARALAAVAESTANFARQCLAAGADGIYLSVRDDWVPESGPVGSPGTYEQLVQPTDLTILDAVGHGEFNILHVCGTPRDFQRFAGYPVQVLSWADRSAGPPLGAVVQRIRPVPCGGLDNLGTMVTGSPDDCARQVADALAQAGSRPILVAPGCTFDPSTVPAANLHAIRQAVNG